MNEPSASSMLYVTAPNPVAILSASVAVTVTSGSVGIVFSSMLTATQSENASNFGLCGSQYIIYARDYNYPNVDHAWAKLTVFCWIKHWIIIINICYIDDHMTSRGVMAGPQSSVSGGYNEIVHLINFIIK